MKPGKSTRAADKCGPVIIPLTEIPLLMARILKYFTGHVAVSEITVGKAVPYQFYLTGIKSRLF